jgi:glycosyltransferase involved in cell wall biosynthesis
MDVSVVVPTRNRHRLLEGTLASLARQTLAPDRFEVLVVDNGSTDGTAETVTRWERSGALRCRRVVEPALGANRARNRGFAEACAEIVAFTDDDVRPEPSWLEALVAAFADGPFGAVGGRVELQWEREPPRWLHRNHAVLLAAFDLGPERRRVDRYPYLVSANLALRASVLRRLGGFDPRLGRVGSNLLSLDETELCRRLVEAGEILLYEPRATVRHFVPTERATLRFLLRRSFDQGRSVCRYQAITGARDRAPSRPGIVFRRLADAATHLLRRDLRESARALTAVAWHLGYLREACSGSGS